MKKIILLLSIFFIGINFVSAKEAVKFYKCVDGDTFRVILKDKEYYVRMLAIDTPESVKQDSEVEYYGKESSEYTCKKLTNAKKIELEYDDNSDKFDKYDRLLAWVYVDGNFLQEELIEKGYAEVAYLYNDYKYADILKEKQELASSKNIGIWDEEAKEKFNNKETETAEEEIDDLGVIIIGAIFLLIIYIINKLIKK